MSNDKKIESLQVLRALAFMGIFLSHAGIAFSWSKLGVSIFFVLSGFLLAYKYSDWNEKVSFHKCVIFSFYRIRKVYGLHIITMIITLAASIYLFIINDYSKNWFLQVIHETILNIFLIQTWVPILDVCVSLNGVAWFLSVMAFLYFCFPIVACRLKENKNVYKCIFISMLIWMLQLFVAICFINYSGMDGHFFNWLTKCCPLFRFGDFLLGCIWGNYFSRSQPIEVFDRRKASICEMGILIAVAVIVVAGKMPRTNLFTKWIWNPTSMYLLAAVMLVVLFFVKKGVITDKLTKIKPLVRLGDISADLFLIHYVIIYYCGLLQNYLLGNNIRLSGWAHVALMIFEFIITLICTFLWRWAFRRMR